MQDSMVISHNDKSGSRMSPEEGGIVNRKGLS